MTIMDDTLNLEVIKVTTAPSDIPDDNTIANQDQYDQEREKIELHRLMSELNHLQGAFNLSKWFAIGIYILVLLSLLSLFWIIKWQGSLPVILRLNDKVLITLLSTTTVNILGLLYLVIRYIFHHRLKL